MRSVFKRVYFRPLSETFPEFLIEIVGWTLDEEWWKLQNTTVPAERHPLRQWCGSWCAFTERIAGSAVATEHGLRFSGALSGPALALVAFGYDLFCLQVENRLPGYVTERLRSKKTFQAAYYEIIVAGIMSRAGFEIEFIDAQSQVGKHCEFLASHPDLTVPVAVEVKSRVRSDTNPEVFDPEREGDDQGLFKLVKKASKQGAASPASPLLIFVDVNLPPTPGAPFDRKPWVADMNKVFDRMLRASADQEPTVWSAIIATNFGLHWGDDASSAAPTEVGVQWSDRARAPIPERLRSAILSEIQAYGRIPSEV